MNELPFVNVDDWKDVAAILIIVIGGWVTTFITLRRGQKRAHQSHDDLNAKVQGIREQVVNGHTTPLRQDMDDMRDTLGLIRDDIRGIRTDINDIRGELRTERTDRLDLEDRFNKSRRHRNAGG